MKRLFYCVMLAIFLVPTASLLNAQTPSLREFSPVQSGFQETGNLIPLFAPNRIMIKFTPKAMHEGQLDLPREKGASVLNAKTGLPSLDALLQEARVSRIVRAQGQLKNMAEAERLGVYNWFNLEVPEGTDIVGVAQRLAEDPNLEWALPDYVAFPAAIPNDPLYANHWGHNNTAQLPDLDWGGTYDHTLPNTVGTVGFDSNAEGAWNGAQGYGNSSIVIAILDSGVDALHPDLLQVAGYDYGDNDNNPDDDSGIQGHGTACAGVAAAIANNNLGIAGIAGSCSIMPLKIANSAGTMYLSAAANALYHAANNGADVASMSFGSAITSYATMDNALQYAYNNGVVLLAATGNENDSTIGYPAINQYVIGVGAASPCGDRKRSSNNSSDLNPGVFADPNGYTCDGERWWGSNYGSATQDNAGAVDIIGPTILPTTDISGNGGYTTGDYSSFFNGTSCATPYTAGVAALVKAVNPSWTPAQIWTQLNNTAIDIVNVESGAGWDRYSGYGMVDAQAAVGGGAIPPAANFTSNTNYGCVPQLVNFQDTSTGTIASWSWTFGDGGSSTAQNPGYTYNVPGIYSVSLTVTGPLGSNTLTINNMITIDQIPAVDFSAIPVSGEFPLTVTFTDLSTNSPQIWLWDFGDGVQSSQQNPVHTYLMPGLFTVNLTAGNNCGNNVMNKPAFIDVVPPPPPLAGFTVSDTLGCLPLDIQFTDTSTGAIGQWNWDFGDGEMSNEQNPMHTYGLPGDFTVTLTVDGPGGTDVLTKNGLITVNDLPIANFSMSDTTGLAPLSIDFTDLSGLADSWAWDFGGDGTSTLENPSHTFTTAGTYPVQLIVLSPCGSDTTSLNVVVTAPEAPVANFGADSSGGCGPLAVAFSDSSTGEITSWIWNFGDGATDTLQSPSHTYTTAGVFDVSLQVTGPGGSNTKIAGEMISMTVVPTAMFAVSDTVVVMPASVTFSDLSAGNPTSWSWSFGDGVSDTLQNPNHIYTENGIYTVTLTATNGCGPDVLVKTGLIVVSSPSASGENVAARFNLGQNYPNPFNPSTTIVFNLAREGMARLEIYDATGRLVDTLVDGSFGPGEHRIQWQPTRLASGVYFARFTAEGKSATRRMALIR